MRISYVTENTIDLASDINASLNEVDGIIPMRISALQAPDLASAIVGEYYLDGLAVCTCDKTKSYWFVSHPELIIYKDELFVRTEKEYKKILAYSDAVLGLLACKTLAEMKTYLGIK